VPSWCVAIFVAQMAFKRSDSGFRDQYRARRTTQNSIFDDDDEVSRYSSYCSISSSFDERFSDAEFVRSFVPPPVVSPPPSPPPPPPPAIPPPQYVQRGNRSRQPSRIPPPPPPRLSQNSSESEPASQQDIIHRSVLSAISGGVKLRHRSNVKEQHAPPPPTSMQGILEKQMLGNCHFSLETLNIFVRRIFSWPNG
jgi:hypothetical protein